VLLTKATRQLARRGADVNAADNNGSTAVMRAAALGDKDTVKALRRLGANLRAVRKHGVTTISMAAANEHRLFNQVYI
jgi:ankyrin repeat protein